LALERSLFIIKPDAVRRNLIGRILAHAEDLGFRVVEARLARLTRAETQTFYAEHQGKLFFERLVEYMTSGPVLLACVEREGAVAELRAAVGATDPAEAALGTVRRLYGETMQHNSVHASDSPASAEREIKFFFGVAALPR
jgi:nucleoside-diphosphate kinase